jgi:hypothetical protein
VTLINSVIFLALSRPGAGQPRLQDQISEENVGLEQRSYRNLLILGRE